MAESPNSEPAGYGWFSRKPCESQLEVKSTGEFVDGSEVRRLGQNARASVGSLWVLGVPKIGEPNITQFSAISEGRTKKNCPKMWWAQCWFEKCPISNPGQEGFGEAQLVSKEPLLGRSQKSDWKRPLSTMINSCQIKIQKTYNIWKNHRKDGWLFHHQTDSMIDMWYVCPFRINIFAFGTPRGKVHHHRRLQGTFWAPLCQRGGVEGGPPRRALFGSAQFVAKGWPWPIWMG